MKLFCIVQDTETYNDRTEQCGLHYINTKHIMLDYVLGYTIKESTKQLNFKI